MANINELLERAASLRDETALNSISPERAGGIMYDTLIALNEIWLQQGAALLISKIYASVAAMEADTAPVSDLTGQPLRPGQIVVIASSDSDNGTVYRYNGTESPSWTAVGKIGNLEPVDSLDSDSTSLPLAAHQGKVLDGKISQLGQKIQTDSFLSTYESNRVSGGLNASGVVSSASWTYTNNNFIPVIPGTEIKYKLRTFSALAIAFYSDANDSSFISGIAAPSTNTFEGISYIPENAKYMRFSTTWDSGQYLFANMANIVDSINELKSSSVSILQAEITENYYINSQGVAVQMVGVSYYTLPVIAGEEILIYCGVNSYSESLHLAFYNGDNFISSEKLSTYSGIGHRFVVPDNASSIKVSFENVYRGKLYFVPNYTSIFNSNENEKEVIPLSITGSREIGIGIAPFCTITKSDAQRITGTGTTTLTLNYSKAVRSGKNYSIGVKFPYSTQNVADVTIGGGNAIEKAVDSPKTKSGKMYKMQGETYQRVNFVSQGETSKTIIVSVDENVSWEIWISTSLLTNDQMPLAPICYIYDGGHWDGHVVWEGQEMSIWTLHRTLGIPYTIAATSPLDTYQSEVLADIERGFAEIITRVGGRNNTLYKQDDADVISGIITECRDHEADNMGAVFATHAFDKDVMRCVKMAGVPFIRTYPTYDYFEKYGSKFGDYDMAMISGHSVSSNALAPDTFMGFPIILWAHGVGDPQSAEEQELRDFYEDKTSGEYLAGTSTIAVMSKILNAQANGNAAAMKASEFIAYCNKYR